MSIVALKKKYLESKNISHNKQFSLNSRRGQQYCKFNMGSLAQTSVKSSSYVHNRRKQWKALMVNSLPENFNGDPSAFKHICNNWVQTTGSDENYIENKALKAICDNSNNATTESNYCNISKKIDTEPSYVSKKIKTLECSKIGYNRPFPYNGSASKPSFITCNEAPVTQIYNAHEYYGFTEKYYTGTTIVNMNRNQDTLDTDSQSNLVVEVETEAEPEVETEAEPEVETEAEPEVETEAEPEVDDNLECLNETNQVYIINSKYVFNNSIIYDENKKYGLGLGTYNITNIPVTHPMAILNSNNEHISYIGDSHEGSRELDGQLYDFYSGDITITVHGDFVTVSIYCINHGYMGGENLLQYSSSCSI